MQLKEASRLFSRAYQDREDVEVKIMQRLCTFQDKSVLEVARDKSTVRASLAKKYKSYLEIKPDELKKEQRKFDVVFTRWTTQHLDIVASVKKMCSLATEAVLVIIPSEKGDLTELKMIKDKETAARRRERAFVLEQEIKKCGCATITIPSLLKFSFLSYDEALEVLMATEFGNSVSHQEVMEIQPFLKRKMKKNRVEISQGALFIAGTKR